MNTERLVVLYGEHEIDVVAVEEREKCLPGLLVVAVAAGCVGIVSANSG